MSGRLFCPVCGDVIGVYEPLLVVAGESVRRSSLAREPGLDTATHVVVHAGCGAEFGATGPNSGSASGAEQAVTDL